MYPRFTTTGKIIYDPSRHGMKRRTKWWVIVGTDSEITRYYRWWVDQQFWGRKIADKPWLHPPAWGAHVSVVRGEKPSMEHQDMWRVHHGEVVQFEYEHRPMKTDPNRYRHNNEGDFWYVHVYCPRLIEIRTELGLKTHHRFHLTFGRSYV